jgi:transcription factor Dp-1
LHDDSFVLKAMGFSGKEETDGTMALVANGVECSSTASIYGHQSPQPARPNGIRLRTSPPIPGILKGRVKHEY